MRLASRIGVALVATALVGASAFAESRPSNETRSRRGEGGRISRGSSGERSSTSRRDNSSNASRQREGNIERRSQRRESDRTDARVEVRGERSPRTGERDRSSRNSDRSVTRDRDRSVTRDRDRSTRDSRDRGSSDRGRYDRDRNDRGRNNNDHRSDRSRSWGRSNDHYRQPYWSHGRVSRVHRYGGGYRIWIVGTPYPFYVPLSYYRHDRFRVGLSIRLGGYYNSLGYYDYYDGRSDGAIRGTVESVDYRRDSFVVRNDATGSFVTILSRDRRLDVRAGDYVELSGEWTRSGVFTAWDVNFL